MQDRVSLYPGRVKLVPVAGQENTYDMVRADSPTQEGTPLNKDSLLKDATAALYGLGADAVPDDVLALLKTIVDKHDIAIANGVKIATGSYTGTGTYGSANPCSLTFDFSPKVVYIYSSDLSPYAEPNYGYWGTCDSQTTVTPFFNTLTSIHTTWRKGSELKSRILNYTIDGNTFTWVMTDTSSTGTTGGPAAAAGAQLNTSNKVYYYFAIG